MAAIRGTSREGIEVVVDLFTLADKAQVKLTYKPY